jgi:hypothetical protein
MESFAAHVAIPLARHRTGETPLGLPESITEFIATKEHKRAQKEGVGILTAKHAKLTHSRPLVRPSRAFAVGKFLESLPQAIQVANGESRNFTGANRANGDRGE